MTFDYRILPQFLFKHRLLFCLCFFAIAFYFFIFSQLGGITFVNKSLFSGPDSFEYYGYSRWLSGEIETAYQWRTFFYPLLVLLTTKLFGFYGLWFFQFMLWLSAGILTFKTVIAITGKTWIGVTAFLLNVFNISLIGYTTQVLTEITVMFLLSLLAFLLTSKNRKQHKWSVLLLLSVLATVKPGFLPLVYFSMVIFLVFQFRNILNKPVTLLLMLLCLSPVIIQKSINKINHGSFQMTQVADINLKEYFFRKTSFYVTHSNYSGLTKDFGALSDQEVREQKKIAFLLPNSIVYAYLFHHLNYSIMVYWDNLKENFNAGNPYFFTNPTLLKLSQNINTNFISWIHLFMALLWLFVLGYKRRFFKTRNYQFVLWLGILAFYELFSSGITFWAGDRLVAPATSICCSLYLCLLFFLFSKTGFEIDWDNQLTQKSI